PPRSDARVSRRLHAVGARGTPEVPRGHRGRPRQRAAGLHRIAGWAELRQDAGPCRPGSDTAMSSDYSLGIDIGGTFTDLVVYDHAGGRQWSRKVLTTPDDPSRAVVAGAGALLRASGIDPRGVGRVVHATTLFTNALIERQGAPTGLITTAGFRDTLEIGRERKFELYDLAIARPESLVPRDRRLEVAERVKADGTVKRALDRRQVEARARQLVDGGVTSIAVVFLHAYANPAHE